MSTASLTTATPTFTPRRPHQPLAHRRPSKTRLLEYLAARTPRRITSDHLTLLGLAAQIAAGLFYALSRTHRSALLAVNACIVLNWLGDSLDGTLARVRHQQRPRFGFYVDHITDLFGATALLAGLAVSGFAHWPSHSPCSSASSCSPPRASSPPTPSRASSSHNSSSVPLSSASSSSSATSSSCAAPTRTSFGHNVLLFDLGGAIGALCMFLLAITLTLRHTAQLFRAEPLPNQHP